VDRARAHALIFFALTAMALAGNALRATEPAAGSGIRLSSIRTPRAGGYTEEALDADFLASLRARDVLYRTYAGSGGDPVWLFLGYFDRQKEGSQVHSPRHCYPGSGWNIESQPQWDSPWGGDRPVHSLVVNDGDERRLVLYWYQLRSGTEMDVLPLKLELTRRALLRRPQEVVFASLSAPTGRDIRATMEELAPLAREVHAEIERLYRQP
jgi:EpsI family protein